MIEKSASDQACADPAAVRADEHALRQWAADRALVHAGHRDVKGVVAFATALVDFVNGVVTIEAQT